MIQLVISGTLPNNPLLKQRCLSNPDILLELSEQANLADSAAGELADRFSMNPPRSEDGRGMEAHQPATLRGTEDLLCAHMSPRLRCDLAFLDIGASDGVTTVGAVHALRRAFGQNVHAYAADVNLRLMRYRRGSVVVYRATDGEPIVSDYFTFLPRIQNSRPAHPS